MSELITFSESLKQISTMATIEEAPEIISKLEKVLSEHPNGIGLSAIQIGIPKRIFIIAIKEGDENKEKFIHFVNPEVIEAEELCEFNGEGCLSYPDQFYTTKRYLHYVLKRGFIDNGEYKEETDYFYYDTDKSHDLVSIAVQHEMDHLDGKVIQDYGTIIPKSSKVGRNDPCPCGKKKDGKSLKYKKCCGK